MIILPPLRDSYWPTDIEMGPAQPASVNCYSIVRAAAISQIVEHSTYSDEYTPSSATHNKKGRIMRWGNALADASRLVMRRRSARFALTCPKTDYRNRRNGESSGTNPVNLVLRGTDRS